MVAHSIPAADAEMLDTELAAWLETQSGDLNGLDFANLGG